MLFGIQILNYFYLVKSKPETLLESRFQRPTWGLPSQSSSARIGCRFCNLQNLNSRLSYNEGVEVTHLNSEIETPSCRLYRHLMFPKFKRFKGFIRLSQLSYRRLRRELRILRCETARRASKIFFKHKREDSIINLYISLFKEQVRILVAETWLWWKWNSSSNKQ